jgi:hypothetical protein
VETKVLIVVPNYWGKGDTIAEAWKQLKKASYKNLRELKTRYKMFVVIDTDDVKSHVSDMGGVVTPKGFPPHLIEEKE